MHSYDLTELDQWMIDMPDTILEPLKLDVINFLAELFEVGDIFLEVLLIEVA